MTFELQIGDWTVILEGELRGEDHKLGPGGILKVISAKSNPGKRIGSWILIGEEVRLIAMPDAPKTTRVNKERLAVE